MLTSIPVVPLICEGDAFDSLEEIKAMVSGTSHFSDAPREGIVVRVCVGGKLLARTKIVRADFIAGNERWNRTSKLATNSLHI